MCYSAQIEADYRRFVHEYGAIMSLDDFTRMVAEYFSDGMPHFEHRAASLATRGAPTR